MLEQSKTYHPAVRVRAPNGADSAGGLTDEYGGDDGRGEEVFHRLTWLAGL